MKAVVVLGASVDAGDTKKDVRHERVLDRAKHLLKGARRERLQDVHAKRVVVLHAANEGGATKDLLNELFEMLPRHDLEPLHPTGTEPPPRFRGADALVGIDLEFAVLLQEGEMLPVHAAECGDFLP